MNTFQLSCFLMVAEYLNFARAAEQLHVTHPAISQQIQSLEKELGGKLFHRTTRSVKLTEEGAAFLNDAQQMVAISQRAKKRFEDPGQQEMTELRIGSQSHTYLRGLADTLDRLRQAYPAVHPRFQSEPVPVLRRRVQEGDLDVLLDFREEDGEKRGIVYRELLKVPVVCLCPADHPLAAKTAVSQEDLKEEKLIVNGPMHSPGAVIRLQGEIIGKRSLTDVYFSDSPETAALLTLAGYGISFLPDLFLPRRARLVKRPLMGIEELSFGLYCRRGDANPVLKEFIRIVEDSL